MFVPRERQGAGRHDNPERYGALYASREPISAVAEAIQHFRGQQIADVDLTFRDGRRLALATFDDSRVGMLVDLDDPRVLVERGLRPSSVATRDRRRTQAIALDAFRDGAHGLSWWSALEASWTNVTLFAERAGRHLVLAQEPEPLALGHPMVVAAASALGIRVH